MKEYVVTTYWKFGSENYEIGIIKALSLEKAIETMKKIYPDAINVFGHEVVFNSDGYSSIFEH